LSWRIVTTPPASATRLKAAEPVIAFFLFVGVGDYYFEVSSESFSVRRLLLLSFGEGAFIQWHKAILSMNNQLELL
jgi:hypothetical protein